MRAGEFALILFASIMLSSTLGVLIVEFVKAYIGVE